MAQNTRPTRLDYCQYLVSSQINYTLTNFAEHSRKFSHDQLNRFLRDDKLSPRMVWEQTKEQLIASPTGFLIFDDTVADKNHSRSIEVVRRQWSGTTSSVIRGIGIVSCIYVNAELNRFWLIDYRIFAPDDDGKTKLDHAREMFDLAMHHKQLEFRCVLMDTWYATRQFMLHIERNGKIYYCPLQANRQVDEGDGTVVKYRRVDSLAWSSEEERAWQEPPRQRLSAWASPPTVPARGLKRSHGLCRHQRCDSNFDRRHTRGVCRSLED